MEKASFKRENFITIQGFMVTDLALSGNELIMYALIHGFSQDGNSYFKGSLSYITTALNVTKANAKKILDRLVEKGLIEKKDVVENGVKYCDYRTKFSEGCYRNDNGGVIETATGRTLFDNGGGIETITHNIEHNNKHNNVERSVEEIIEEKRVKLREICEPYVAKYGRPMVEAFINYWGEANGKRLRWEVTKQNSGAFEFSRRLANWASKDYNKPFVQPYAKPTTPPKKQIWEELGMTREQYLEIHEK